MVRDNLTAMIWKDKQDMHMLMNICRLPPEGSFCEERGKA